jgi:hypothetical protein
MTQKHTHTHTVGLLWTRDRPLYLTTHNTHKRQTSMPLAGFEPAIPASERPQNYALDRAATKHYGKSDFSNTVGDYATG